MKIQKNDNIPIVLLNEFNETIFVANLKVAEEISLVEVIDNIRKSFIFLCTKDFLCREEIKVERDSKRIFNNLNFSFEANDVGEINGFIAESSLPYFNEIIYISPVSTWKNGCATWKEYYQFTVTKKDISREGNVKGGKRYVVGKENNDTLLANVREKDVFVDFGKLRSYVREDKWNDSNSL